MLEACFRDRWDITTPRISDRFDRDRCKHRTVNGYEKLARDRQREYLRLAISIRNRRSKFGRRPMIQGWRQLGNVVLPDSYRRYNRKFISPVFLSVCLADNGPRAATHILAIGQRIRRLFCAREHPYYLAPLLSSRQFGQIRASFVLSLLVSFEEEIVAAAEHAARKSTRVLEKLLGITTPRGLCVIL